MSDAMSDAMSGDDVQILEDPLGGSDSSGTDPFDDAIHAQMLVNATIADRLEESLRHGMPEKSAKGKRTRKMSKVRSKRQRQHGPEPAAAAAAAAPEPVPQSSDPGRITAQDRVAQFPGQTFEVHKTTSCKPVLWCACCGKPVATKKTTIKNHLKSERHRLRLAQRGKLIAAGNDAAQRLQKWFTDNPDVEGRTVTEQLRAYRLAAVKMCLQSGIPLKKLRTMAPVLEQYTGLSLGSVHNHAAPYIKILAEQEHERIRNVLHNEGGGHFSVMFDGTTADGEAMAVVGRVVTANFEIKQVTMSFQLYSKSMTSKEIAAAIYHVIVTTYGLDIRRMISAHRDRASANGAAITLLRLLAPGFIDVGCFSHTLANAGKTFDAPDRKAFVIAYNGLFTHSPYMRLLFKAQFGVKPLRVGQTRWGSEWEVTHQIVEIGLKPIFEWLSGEPTQRNLCPENRARCLTMLRDAATYDKLLLQLAAVDDAGSIIVRALYNLEGDGPLVFTASFVMAGVMEGLRNLKTHPQRCLHQVAIHVAVQDRIAGVAAPRDASAVYREALSIIEPAIAYIDSRFGGHGALSGAMGFFAATRLLHPAYVHRTQPPVAAVDALKLVPFVTDRMVSKLQREYPQYLLSAGSFTNDDTEYVAEEARLWWQTHSGPLSSRFKTWVHVAQLAAFVVPSSASAERVFSHYNAHISPLQDHALEDIIQLRLQLQDRA
mmetsp:Transcript_57565/g.135468  ORF Transcript_57565/g.135468 Transcript_57565/m.135468 type:complete len:712 (+) Transcript_57565:75-2210(+)